MNSMTQWVLYVGSERDSANQAIPLADQTRMLQTAQVLTAQRFGGFSIQPVHGGWIDPATGGMVLERSYRFELVTDSDAALVQQWATEVGAVFHQTSVLLTGHALETAEFLTVNALTRQEIAA